MGLHTDIADAKRALTSSALRYHRARAELHEVIRTAVAFGVSRRHVHEVTSLNRKTVDRIVEQQKQSERGVQLVRKLGAVRELPEDPWA